MMQVARLSGGRLHLHHGPIDLIVWAEGEQADQARAQAVARFDGLLAGLVTELPQLRSPAPLGFSNPIARVMAAAVAPFRPAFITPMAAVAGAVADAVLAAMCEGTALARAYVNNGGDIALHLSPGHSLTAAMAGCGRVTVRHGDGIGGIATSGRGGRSFSLGIADAVTVLARSAAMADAAATMVANAVDLPGHPAIIRRPANQLQADNDLGDRPVTTALSPLTKAEVTQALTAGEATARRFAARGLLAGAGLFLHSQSRTIGCLGLEKEHALV